jgi:hypothetical protein
MTIWSVELTDRALTIMAAVQTPIHSAAAATPAAQISCLPVEKT